MDQRGRHPAGGGHAHRTPDPADAGGARRQVIVCSESAFLQITRDQHGVHLVGIGPYGQVDVQIGASEAVPANVAKP